MKDKIITWLDSRTVADWWYYALVGSWVWFDIWIVAHA